MGVGCLSSSEGGSTPQPIVSERSAAAVGIPYIPCPIRGVVNGVDKSENCDNRA